VAPTKVVVKDGKAVGLELQRMELGEPDASGRRRPVPVPGTETVVEADTIIPAVSQKPDVAFVCEQGLELTRWGTLTIDELTCGTTVPGLFAGGDAVRGPASVIEAMADGKRAAQAMDNTLSGRPVSEGLKPPARPLEPPTAEERLTLRIETPCQPRVAMPVLDPAQRVCSFDEVELGYTATQAMEEAARCLNCGVCSECRECAKVCEAGAIDYEMEDTVREIEVGAVILATGFELFDASRAPQYGYGRLDNVYTSLEVERLCEASGPTQGKVLLRDGREPQSVAILHCIGSRDANYNKYCSRVCCMYSLKLAHLIQEKTEARVYEFYIDMRAFGKGYEEFYERVQREGVIFVRGKGAEVTQEDGRLVVLAEDTELGRPVRVPVDMVVLSVGLEPRRDAHEVSRLFNVSRTADGFFLEAHPKLRPVDTNVDGVFLAGACQGPKDIPDTVAQGAAAAMRAVALMDKGWVEIEPSVAEVNIALCSGCGDCIALCPSQAIERVEGHAEVNATLCKGCGTCVVACRPKAITLKHFDDRQVVAELEGLLSRMAYQIPVTAEVLE
jgi:heterodisulfide reductase subunit A